MAFGGVGTVLLEEVRVTFAPAIDLGFDHLAVELLPCFDSFSFGDGSVGAVLGIVVEALDGVGLRVVAHAGLGSGAGFQSRQRLLSMFFMGRE